MGGGGGGTMSPQCSAVSASSAGGAGGVPSPSLPLTQTPMHRSIMDALHWCQRKTEAERGRHGEKTRRDTGEGAQQRKKETALRTRKRSSRKCLGDEGARVGRVQRGNRQTDRRKETSIKSLDQ